MLVEDTLEAAERQNPSVDESSGTDVEMEPGSSRPKVSFRLTSVPFKSSPFPFLDAGETDDQESVE